MQGFIKSLVKSFSSHSKICVINENNSEVNRAVSLIKKHNIIADGYTDYRKLLYELHSTGVFPYALVIIHENGNKSKPTMLSSFIRQLHPNLQVITYKTPEQLEKQIQAFC